MKRSVLVCLGMMGQIGGVFLKIGLVFFGGGYVLIPILHRELIGGRHWLTEREFLDGVAISQLTPGPIAIISTFCGFRQGGILGALVATVAVFLPAFVLMVFISRGYAALKNIIAVRSVLNVIIPAIVGVLLATAIEIGRSQKIFNPMGIGIFAASLILMIRWKINPAILIGAGVLLGLIFHL